MRVSKVIIPIAATTVVIGCLVKKGKFPVKFSKVISDIAQNKPDTTVEVVEKTFGGLKQSVIDELVENTYRASKAVINGDTLDYWFKSASGKNTYQASLILDSLGKINIQLVKAHPEATSSPLAFGRSLLEAMKMAE